MNSPDTKLTGQERTMIQTQSTEYHNETVKDPLTQKLLLCLLETVQDLTAEVKQLRKSHEQTQDILQKVLSMDYGNYCIAVKQWTCNRQGN